MSEWTVDPVALKHVCPNLDDRQASDIARGLGEAFHRYGIDNERRAAMAVAQWAEESDHFKTSEEYASGSAYEGRRDLGNTHPGDGVRFKGRGRIMITGRLNYTAMAHVLELDLVAHPELLGQPPHSELASGQWWHDHECNTFSDATTSRASRAASTAGSTASTSAAAFTGWRSRSRPGSCRATCGRSSPTTSARTWTRSRPSAASRSDTAGGTSSTAPTCATRARPSTGSWTGARSSSGSRRAGPRGGAAPRAPA